MRQITRGRRPTLTAPTQATTATRGLLWPALLLAALLATQGGCNILTGEAALSETNEKENHLAAADTGGLADGSTTDTAGTDVGLPSDVSNGNADGGGAVACGCLKEGDWFRFDKLQIDSLDGAQHNVMIVLNPLWKQDVVNLELNFYFQVIKVSGTEVTLNVVNGARLTGTTDQTCLLPYTSAQLSHPRDGCTLNESTPSAMNVYAGTEINKKNCAPKNAVPHAIEVRKAIMKAEFSADCSKIISGKVVSGSLGKAALEQTCTCVNPGKLAEECGVVDPGFVGNSCDGCNDKYQNLKTLLENFGELQWKCTVDGKPAVCLEASFSAVRIDKAPGICPGL